MQVCGKDFQVGEVILGLDHAENELLKAFDHLRTASSRPPAALTRGLASTVYGPLNGKAEGWMEADGA